MLPFAKGYCKRIAQKNQRVNCLFSMAHLQARFFPTEVARVWLVLHIAPIRLKNAAMPKTQVFMFFVHFTLCTFHRSFFLREFRSFSGLFSFKRLAVTNTKKRKICYKPFDFFFPDSKVKKIGGAYQRPQGGGRGGGGRWSNGGRGQKWKGHLCVLRSKTHIRN